MQVVYRLFVFLLGVVGAAAALGINVFFSLSTRFQNVVGLHPDASHGWLGLGCALVAFIGACLLLFRVTIPVGAGMLMIGGIGFFFVVNWWAALASPQMILAAFFAIYYYLTTRHVRSLEARLQASEGTQERPPRERPPQERPPQEGGTAAAS